MLYLLKPLGLEFIILLFQDFKLILFYLNSIGHRLVRYKASRLSLEETLNMLTCTF